MDALGTVFFVVMVLAGVLILSLQVRELYQLCREEKKLLKRLDELRGDLKVRLGDLEYLREKCPDWATETRERLDEDIARIRKVLA